jgi:imidazolonepropionase-like amidohydrolase
MGFPCRSRVLGSTEFPSRSRRGVAPALAAAAVAAMVAASSGCATGGAPAGSAAAGSPAAGSAAPDSTAAAQPAGSRRGAGPAGAAAADPASPPSPYPSTYQRRPSPPVLITHATVLTGTGARLANTTLLLRDGRIAAVGPGAAAVAAPAGAEVIDATGKWVTPGIVDPHSHLGVYPSPGVEANADGNEATNPDTANVWAEHSVWPQDPQFPLALAGGVTTMQILPGSANLFGGRSVTVKNVPAASVDAMKFPGAPYGLKMACGENPKRVYGGRGRAPSTRMGNVAGYREAWIRAVRYRDKWREYHDKKAHGKDADPPDRDLGLETLAGVLDGNILVQNHCYRADEMLTMIDISHEFGFHIAAFHHAVEAYKIAGTLAQNGICADMWADWWGFKMEALDGIRENLAMVSQAGACAVVHSDSAEGIQRLNQEAAKAMAAGRRAGIAIAPEDAIRWLTINPARSIGVDRETGSLEPGKMADVVIWSGDPFSVYSRAEKVYIDGALMYDRGDPRHQPLTDFDLGLRDGPGGPAGGAAGPGTSAGALVAAAGPDVPAVPAPAASPATAAAAAKPAGTAGPARSGPHPAAAGETLAITGATVHTMGPAGTLRGATVVIAGGRIQAVGNGIAVPAGARQIDAAGKVVTPGLFDSLTHLGLVEVNQVEDTEDATNEDPQLSAAFDVAGGINSRSMLLPINRVEGITRAVTAPGTGRSLFLGQGAVIHLGGGPLPVVRRAVAQFVALGEAGARLAGGTRGGAVIRLREALRDALDYDANRAAYDRAQRRPYSLPRLDLEALLPVARGERPLVVQVNRASDIEAVLALARELKLRLILADAAEGWEVAAEIAAARVPVLINPLSNLPQSFEALGATLENAARLGRAGVTLAFASGDSHNSRNLRQAAGNAAAYGLPREAALAAMTANPARIWGIEDYGTLEAGKDADVVIWDGDPLEVTTAAERVFIRGVEMPNDSRQIRLRDRYRQRG